MFSLVLAGSLTYQILQLQRLACTLANEWLSADFYRKHCERIKIVPLLCKSKCYASHYRHELKVWQASPSNKACKCLQAFEKVCKASTKRLKD